MLTHHDVSRCSDDDRHDRIEDEPGGRQQTSGIALEASTHSHFQPGTPALPSSVDWMATCMNETNICEAGYEVPKMAIRVANSRGVLHKGKRESL